MMVTERRLVVKMRMKGRWRFRVIMCTAIFVPWRSVRLTLAQWAIRGARVEIVGPTGKVLNTISYVLTKEGEIIQV